MTIFFLKLACRPPWFWFIFPEIFIWNWLHLLPLSLFFSILLSYIQFVIIWNIDWPWHFEYRWWIWHYGNFARIYTKRKLTILNGNITKDTQFNNELMCIYGIIEKRLKALMIFFKYAYEIELCSNFIQRVKPLLAHLTWITTFYYLHCLQKVFTPLLVFML